MIKRAGMIFEKQQYQEDCVNNIIRVLGHTNGVGDLSNLRDGIKQVQEESKIPVRDLRSDNHLDILMETGTGKTFTYLKTMFEMNRRFAIKRFVIFVPRLAIRAGIIQNIHLTKNHFYREYSKKISIHTYESGNLYLVNNYLDTTNDISLLILTSQSIATKSSKGSEVTRILTRRINEKSLLNPGESPLESISRLSPVIFLDEPHLLTGNKFNEAYKENFSSSLLLRFGATYPEGDNGLSNVVYVLDSLTAFRSRLVKKIRVHSFNDTRFGVRFSKKINTNEVEICYPKDGNIAQRSTITKKDDIGVITGVSEYAGVFIVSIKGEKIFLSNNQPHFITQYALDKETARAMIKETIDRHFKKEQTLFEKGIKTLSLFFIPNINDFRGNNPVIKNIFEEEYKRKRSEVLPTVKNQAYKRYLERDFDGEALCVHDGYFSGDNNSSSEDEKKINQGVSIILDDKTKLLSTETPLRFIFSVWALQEGWDNPNIFNLCKLSSTRQTISRRQQVGRGLRIAVNNQGARQTVQACDDNISHFYDINMLDVFVSSQEGDFIEEIQREIAQSSFTFGGNQISHQMLRNAGLRENEATKLLFFLDSNNIIEFSDEHGVYLIKRPPVKDFLSEKKANLPPVLKAAYDTIMKALENEGEAFVENANDRDTEISIRQKHLKEFKELWHTITKKAQINYKDIEEKSLITAIANSFKKEKIEKNTIIKKEQVLHDGDQIEFVGDKNLGSNTFLESVSSYRKFILDFSKENKLPLLFIISLFNKLDKEKIKNNPDKAQQLLAKIIEEEIHKSVIASVSYNFNSEIAIKTNSPLFNEDGSPKKKIKANLIGKYSTDDDPADAFLFKKIRYDSSIERRASRQSDAAKEIDTNKVKVFAKLPHISIPTPYKNYNPDFAYYLESKKGKKIFFIVETKGYDRAGQIPTDEQIKIEYAKKFFQQLNKEIGDDIDVVFKPRINNESLTELLKGVGEQTP